MFRSKRYLEKNQGAHNFFGQAEDIHDKELLKVLKGSVKSRESGERSRTTIEKRKDSP